MARLASTARRRRMLDRMARVLADTTPEIRNPVACRDALAAAGFDDEWIAEALDKLQRRARSLRAAEIERLNRKAWP